MPRDNRRRRVLAYAGLLVAGIASPASGWAEQPTATQIGLIADTTAGLLASFVGSATPPTPKKSLVRG